MMPHDKTSITLLIRCQLAHQPIKEISEFVKQLLKMQFWREKVFLQKPFLTQGTRQYHGNLLSWPHRMEFVFRDFPETMEIHEIPEIQRRASIPNQPTNEELNFHSNEKIGTLIL